MAFADVVSSSLSKLGRALWPFSRRPRNLARDLRNQSTEEYWRRRERSRARALRLVSLRYRSAFFAAVVRDNVAILRGTLFAVSKGLALGALFFGAIFAVEWYLTGRFFSQLVPPSDSAPPFGSFPTLAVQVSASLLGFYLASVSIVLGTSYHDVSADVRALILESALVRLYLKLVGMAIGAGLALVLLSSTAVSYGYLSVGVYTLFVLLSAWALFQLAVGAFNLFNPIVLGQEPLRLLYRDIRRLDSKGLTGNEPVARAFAHNANRNLLILAELMQLTKGRASINRTGLDRMVEDLMTVVRVYAGKKHLLPPTSGWFVREVAYPKWVEASHSEASLALSTRTPLQPRMEPGTDWLEKRCAELVSGSIEMCVSVGDRDAALRITRAVAQTAYFLARSYRVDDAVTFSALVRDRCWELQPDSPAAVAVMAEPPLFLSNLLLGWQHAMASWPDEVRSVVEVTKWDNRRTNAVAIRGPRRVWTTAQNLLQEIKAEHDIEGRRVTPNWYLRHALAESCILTLREFANGLPDLLDGFIRPALSNPSPEVKAMAGAQALQAQSKAQLVVETIHRTPENFQTLRMGDDLSWADEFTGLGDRVDAYRWLILRHTADNLKDLAPDNLRSEPDLFGQAWFTLLHHVEEAIANGNTEFVQHAFHSLLPAALRFEGHLLSTYQPPTYRRTPAMVDPVIDLLELSGLALIYAVIRDDRSDIPVQSAWNEYILSRAHPQEFAKHILDVLEIAQGGLALGISPRSVTRTEWGIRVENRIREAGFARPRFIPFEDPPAWDAPPLIKMLGVEEHGGSNLITPRAIFAAESIVPLTGESDDDLENYRSLRFYYQYLRFHSKEDTLDGDDAASHEGQCTDEDVP